MMMERSISGKLRFSSFEVDLHSKELRDERRLVRLAPQAFRLLELLVSRPGQLVTRDEIRDAIWSGNTFVDFEHSINKSVRQIRAALRDDAETPRFIQTLPRRGYRFIADVVPTEETALSGPVNAALSPEPFSTSAVCAAELEIDAAAARKNRRTTSRMLWIAVAAALLASAAAVGSRYLRARADVLRALQIVPFTTFPGGEYEPAFSPDGSRVAFVWSGEANQNFDIYVKAISSGAVLRLTNDPGGDGSPAWSPDGRSIAFVRYSLISEANGVYIIPASGGVERKLTSLRHLDHIFDSHLDWSPDGRYLAVVDKESDNEPFGIFLVSAETGERRRLTSAPPQSLGDTGPRFAPDGLSLVFRRTLDSAVNDLYSCRLQQRPCAAKRLTFGNACTKSHAWIRGGRELIYSDTHGFWRIPRSGGKPTEVLGLAGGAAFIAASRQGDRLAYSVWSADTNIWRTALDGGRSEGNARPLIASTRDERSPQYAPDGKMIAFRSDRSGSSEIWLCDSQGENPVQLTFFGGPLTGSPRWSPDGLQIVFDSRPEGNSDIYAIRIASGAIRRITYDPAADVLGSWSSDGRWIYFASNRSGRWEIWKTPSDASAFERNAIQVTHAGGFAPLESPDGKTLFYAKGPDVGGLWAVPVSGGPERLVVAQLKAGYWGYWAPARGRIDFIDAQPRDTAAVYAFSTETHTTTKIATLPKPPPYGDSGFSVSPDGHWMLYTQVDHSGSDIMLANLR